MNASDTPRALPAATKPSPLRLLVGVSCSIAVCFFTLLALFLPGAQSASTRTKQPKFVHLTTRTWREDAQQWRPGQELQEEWRSEDGFSRFETHNSTTGKLGALRLERGAKLIRYQPSEKVEESDLPPSWADPSMPALYLPTRRYFEAGLRLFSEYAKLKTRSGRNFAFWRSRRKIILAEGVFTRPLVGGHFYGHWQAIKGDRVRIRAEVDAQTDRLLELAAYQRSPHSNWRPVAKTSFEWLDRIPAALLTFVPPKGTLVTQKTFWRGRTDKTIATASADGWKFALHALERNTQGDLCATVSAVPTTGREITLYDVKFLLAGQAEDDASGKYHFVIEESLGDRGYHIIGLKRDANPPARQAPQKISLTVWREAEPSVRVTFKDLPLPPPLTRDNLLIQSVRTYRVGD